MYQWTIHSLSCKCEIKVLKESSYTDDLGTDFVQTETPEN